MKDQLVEEGVRNRGEVDEQAQKIIVPAGWVLDDKDVEVLDHRDDSRDHHQVNQNGVLDNDVHEAEGFIERSKDA